MPTHDDRLHLIAGVPTASAGGGWLNNVDPTTGTVLGRIADGGAEDVERAVAAAQHAWTQTWSRMPLEERLACLDRAADWLADHADALADAECLDTGRPRSLARTLDVPRAAANVRFFAALQRQRHDTSWVMTRQGVRTRHHVMRQPKSLVAVICPWNLPLLLLTWKCSPALAAGACVIAKPSELTPSSALLFAEALRAGGVPPGVFQLLQGQGAGVGAPLVSHPAVQAITFTGSTATGRAIARAAAERLVPVSLELGGKNPAIVREDAPLESTVAGLLRSTFTNCGQVCLCTERIYIHRSRYTEVRDALVAEARTLRGGAPDDPASTLGPLISATQREKVREAIAGAESRGGTSLLESTTLKVPEALAGGFWQAPTLMEGLPHNDPFLQEEVFGPVAHLQPFDTDAEAVALANDSRYGLCASIWTQDQRRAWDMGRALRVGMVWTNDWMARDLRVPFGGMLSSGLGREGGEYALDFATEPQTLSLQEGLDGDEFHPR